MVDDDLNSTALAMILCYHKNKSNSLRAQVFVRRGKPSYFMASSSTLDGMFGSLEWVLPLLIDYILYDRVNLLELT